MYTITFYSFKGGVGRTMALVNVAAELAKMGRKVLVVDFDLEAPGLETFERLRPPQPHPGIVEYVTEYMRTKCSPDVRDYIYSAGKVGKKNGELWVMPAGRRDRDYHLALYRLDWRRLYEQCDGFVFFEDLKAQWEQLESKPHYVLIDSRTGDTDVKGICTRQLPDAVVMLFIPNEQNLAGLRAVCQEIRREREHGLKKDIRLHFVPSNVPDLDDEHGLMRKQLDVFNKELTIYLPSPRIKRVVIHRYESLGMLEQPVFVLQRPKSRLAREYRRLVRSLIMENPVDRDGALFYLRALERDSKLQREWRGHSSLGLISRRVDASDAEARLRQIESQFKDDAIVLRRLAWLYQGLGELDLALRQYDSVLRLRPGWSPVLFERGRCRRQARDKAGAAEDLLRYLQSSALFARKWEEEDEDEYGRLLEDASTALRELLDVSFEAFVEALDSPGVRETALMGVVGGSIWFNSAAEHLLRERRWKDVVQYLLTELPKLNGPEVFVSHYEGERVWYLAMARWGDTGRLPSDLCQTSLELFQKACGDFEKGTAAHFQRMSLLYWGIGDSENASALLDRALAEFDKTGLISEGEGGVSNWTFREAAAHEFRQHCEEQRRMIQGEPIRPAFLGPPLASHIGGFISPSESPPK
ncbi:MAG TPA: ParA family protein [Gemmataceae bacterium]|nr:ParA family protein [Gemmataceae bacterium]